MGLNFKKFFSYSLVLSMTAVSIVGCTKSTDVAEYPEYNALECVKLGKYKGLNIASDAIPYPTDAEIKSKVSHMMPLKSVSDGARMGDAVNIDFHGKLKGKSFTGGDATNYNFELGSGNFVGGFEEYIVGMKKGEEKELIITFPDTYERDFLRGQNVEFKIKLNSVSRPDKLTNSNVDAVTGGTIKTVSALVSKTKKEMKEKIDDENEAKAKSALLSKIHSESEIKKVPTELKNWLVESSVDRVEREALKNHMSMDDYVRKSEDFKELAEVNGKEITNVAELTEYYKKNAKNALAGEILLNAIAEKENIEVTRAEYKERVEELAKKYGYDKKSKFESEIGKSNIKNQMLIDEVVDFLMEKNAVTGYSINY